MCEAAGDSLFFEEVGDSHVPSDRARCSWHTARSLSVSQSESWLATLLYVYLWTPCNSNQPQSCRSFRCSRFRSRCTDHLDSAPNKASSSFFFQLSLSLSLFLSLCLCQTNLHMRVARQTPPNRQELCKLHSASSREGSAASRSAALDPSARKFVSACAVNSTRSSWVLHRPTACGLHCPFAAAFATKVTQQLGAFAFQSSKSVEDQRPQRPYHNASFSPLPQRLQPLLVSTHFRCNFLRAGIVR